MHLDYAHMCAFVCATATCRLLPGVCSRITSDAVAVESNHSQALQTQIQAIQYYLINKEQSFCLFFPFFRLSRGRKKPNRLDTEIYLRLAYYLQAFLEKIGRMYRLSLLEQHLPFDLSSSFDTEKPRILIKSLSIDPSCR